MNKITNKELELKFLVKSEELKKIIVQSVDRKIITQGYLFGSMNFRVRNTIENDTKKSHITIKSDRDGIERDEFEYEIPYEEGIILLEKFCNATVYKTRYIVYAGKGGKDKWEVDDFHGKNAGLVIAELEVPRLDYDVHIPDWAAYWVEGSNGKKYSQGIDVSDDDRYYNYNLAVNPYSEWKDEGR